MKGQPALFSHTVKPCHKAFVKLIESSKRGTDLRKENNLSSLKELNLTERIKMNNSVFKNIRIKDVHKNEEYFLNVKDDEADEIINNNALDNNNNNDN